MDMKLDMPMSISNSENDVNEFLSNNADQKDAFCYCGKSRTVGEVELQCGRCLKFYHYECISCYIGGTCIPFMVNYQFCCKRCNPNEIESFTKKTANFTQMCMTAVANLTHQHSDRNLFSKDREIIPFIDKHWENLTNVPRRVKLNWHNTVYKTLFREADIFIGNEESAGDHSFGFSNIDLSQIGPNFESCRMVSGVVKPDSKLGSTLPDSLGKTRNYKRRFPLDQSNVIAMKQKKGDVTTTTRLALSGYPLEHPFNKDGYRYILAEIDPHSPHRQAFDESQETAGKPIPGSLYRIYQGSEVLLALHDRAPQLKISDDRLSVTGEKGYCMVRASHGISKGSWYFEVYVTDMPDNTATRIGWSQQLGNLQAPCGYDKFSYSWRSRKGTVFHESRGKHFSSAFGQGDTVGCHIYVPPPNDPSKLLPRTCKDMPLVKFKSHLYYEAKDQVSESEKLLKPAQGSKISFYKNGQPLGDAFKDIYEGTYYPTISLYKNVTVTVNFGPQFHFPPKDLKLYEPMNAFAVQAVIEHSLSDILFHVENDGCPLDY